MPKPNRHDALTSPLPREGERAGERVGERASALYPANPLPFQGRGRSRTRTHSHTPGFTLLEILVVLVIVGIVLGLVSVRIAPDERQTLTEEARRLALLFEHARDEAVMTGTPLAWQANGTEHGFWQRDSEGEWKVPLNEEPFRRRLFTPPVTLADLEIHRTKVPVDSRLIFTPSGVNAPFQVELALREHRVRVVGEGSGRIALAEVGQ